MPKLKQVSAAQPLRGEELLQRVKELRALNKSGKARACGYVTFSRSGSERVRIREFMSAVIEAQGIKLNGSSSTSRGRNLSYRATVQQNGNIIIGSGYTREMNLDPGDRFYITLGRNKIKLTAIDAEHSDANEFEDFTADDEEFDDDEID